MLLKVYGRKRLALGLNLNAITAQHGHTAQVARYECRHLDAPVGVQLRRQFKRLADGHYQPIFASFALGAAVQSARILNIYARILIVGAAHNAARLELHAHMRGVHAHRTPA